MPQLIVPGSWQNSTSGTAFAGPAATLRELLDAFVRSHPEAGYRLYSAGGGLLGYHLFVVDGEQVPRRTSPDEVGLAPGSRVEIIPPLAGG